MFATLLHSLTKINVLYIDNLQNIFMEHDLYLIS